MSVAIMWNHLTAVAAMQWLSDKTEQRKLCFMGQLRSYVTRSVRWRVWVQSDSWMWESAARPAMGNKSALYLNQTNNHAVLQEVMCFSWNSGALCMFSMQVKGRNQYICVGWSVRKSICIHCFDSSVRTEVIVALHCALTACVHFPAPPNTKGIQPSQTWHRGLQQDGPPHESI